ncbi:endonuclease/exonuclease/phosphatase family protein [Streptomyces sp. NPDC052396]|uniref:endonuclease/exonuclease/phosphatase family protein n=1 Tax=Streptomyces sp. NPDC052396 TaxID=3365689 RepID=UPI0037CD8273
MRTSRIRTLTRRVTVGLLGGAAVALTLPASASAAVESVRAMTWNICGEAGGPPGDSSYCPYRNEPKKKAQAIAEVVRVRKINAVLLQEVCSGPPRPGGAKGHSQLDEIQAALGKGWSAAWAESKRPDGRSDCRGKLSGTLSTAILVRGKINHRPKPVPLPVPLHKDADRNQVMCVGVAGWKTHVCTTHMSNNDQLLAAGVYEKEVATVKKVISAYPRVVLGGDFNMGLYNHRIPARLQPLYQMMPECDRKSYAPGDATDEATHFSFDPRTGGYTESKIDYLFGTAGFTGCDSWTQKADQADYRYTKQPTGISDHAPLYGYTKAS